MTKNKEIDLHLCGELPRKGLSCGDTVFCIVSLVFLLLTLLCSEVTTVACAEGLRICAGTLIPSLFPFMVISSLLVSSGAADMIGKVFAPPMRTLFGISGESSCALIMGILCGFPIGTKTALSLYENKKIGKNELCHLLMLCNLPSSAFLINAVGASLFGNKKFGVILYAVNIASVVIIGIITRPFLKKDETAPKKNDKKRRQSGIALFTSVITDSAVSMLYVCAFVVFFSALVGTLESIFASLRLPSILSPLWLGIFELTQGMTHAALCPSPKVGMIFAAASSGWSGLSVHFQIMSICRDTSVSFRPYFLSKLGAAIINTAIVALIILR